MLLCRRNRPHVNRDIRRATRHPNRACRARACARRSSSLKTMGSLPSLPSSRLLRLGSKVNLLTRTIWLKQTTEVFRFLIELCNNIDIGLLFFRGRGRPAGLPVESQPDDGDRGRRSIAAERVRRQQLWRLILMGLESLRREVPGSANFANNGWH